MVKPLGIAAVLAGAVAAGCGGAGARGSAPERARDAVRTFVAVCGRGEWQAATGILTDGTRRAFVAAGDPADACLRTLGAAPAAVRAIVGDDDRRVRDALLRARMGAVRVDGDQAEVEVAIAGAPGRAELSDSGERFRLALPH